jgi:hypothetical protein
MMHLLLSNQKAACGAEGKSSSLIQLVNCGRCHAWHDSNEFAKSMFPPSVSGYTDDERPALELVLCSCGCGEVVPKAQAKWDEADSLPYINLKHMAEHQQEKEDAFEQANADMNGRLHAEHRERRNG